MNKDVNNLFKRVNFDPAASIKNRVHNRVLDECISKKATFVVFGGLATVAVLLFISLFPLRNTYLPENKQFNAREISVQQEYTNYNDFSDGYRIRRR